LRRTGALIRLLKESAMVQPARPIKQEDFIQSVADALQFISYYHPTDFVQAMAAAYQREQSPAAKDALAQILINSRMSAEGHRPICQDTGNVVVMLKVGMNARWDTQLSIQAMCNEAVRRAYTFKENILRASMLADPAGKRSNTRDNTPAIVHFDVVPGDTVEVHVAAKGGGSDNKSKMTMLLPNDNVVDWVLQMVPTMGADWCPPGILSLGIGGSPEMAPMLAKWAMMEPVDMHELIARGPANSTEALRIELFEKVNALGIGAQGLGGLTTVLDVKVSEMPCHAASKPVALLPNCAATRHAHFVLDGSGPVALDPPSLDLWPKLELDFTTSRRVNLDTVTPAEVATWKSGDRLLLNGKLLTGRDAAHKRLTDMMAAGEKLPVDFTNRFIYYVGPVDPVRDEAVGPAGPTTSSRMDKFVEPMLANTGLLGMVGKSERGPAAIDSIRKHKAVYCIAVGGAAYLVSKAIRASKVLAFPELGMEAIYEFEVKDMPVTVAVDSEGGAVHKSGPATWKIAIEKMKTAVPA
jgi:fumarate hydratase, class I